MDEIQRQVICLSRLEVNASAALIETFLERYGAVLSEEKPEMHRGLMTTLAKMRALMARSRAKTLSA